jgi:hypothetical protein
MSYPPGSVMTIRTIEVRVEFRLHKDVRALWAFEIRFEHCPSWSPSCRVNFRLCFEEFVFHCVSLMSIPTTYSDTKEGIKEIAIFPGTLAHASCPLTKWLLQSIEEIVACVATTLASEGQVEPPPS